MMSVVPNTNLMLLDWLCELYAERVSKVEDSRRKCTKTTPRSGVKFIKSIGKLGEA